MATAAELQVIISSATTQQEFKVEWLEAEAPNGCFVICPGHIDLLSELKTNGQLSFKMANGVTNLFKVNGSGIIHVQGGTLVQILIFNN